MFDNFLPLLTLLSSAVFAATALASWLQPGARPRVVKSMSTAAAIISILQAGACGFLVINNGLLETDLIGMYGLGLSLRLDALSVLMLTMIALLGFIVVRFSINYLDGDPRQGIFLGRLAATIASVQLLVLSGNLGLLLVSWILTSISLHRLLVFYWERPGAIIAARKKFILARLGDASLLVAIVFLYRQFGTGNLEMIFSQITTATSRGGSFPGLEAAALFLALAAILKSAQFPTHGWLVEVMETPTPVSALLHAGLLNAGPFLILRMAYVMDASDVAPLFLIIIGGFTALFASVVYLTQTSIKTALGYSSVAHMGFSLMVCGLGVYPAAMLHLVAHSFYKAHSFLSSGSVIEVVRTAKIATPARLGSPLRMVLGILLALGVYVGFSMVWGIDPIEELPLLAIGAIIVMGLARIFTSAIDVKGNAMLLLPAGLLAMVVALAFFSLEEGMHFLLATQLPEVKSPGFLQIILTGLLLLAFAGTVFIQILAPTLTPTPFSRALAVHLRNGFYANAVFDRMVGALRTFSPEAGRQPAEPNKMSRKGERVETGKLEQELV